MLRIYIFIIFVFVLKISTVAQTPLDKRNFERIFSRMENRLEKNYRTPNEQNIIFFEYVFDEQQNIRFAAHIDGFIITDPWFTFTMKARKKGINEHLCFLAEVYNLDSLKYFGREGRGTIIGQCPYHTGLTAAPVTTLAARIEYENDAKNRPKTDFSTQNLPTIINKAFYTQVPIDSGFFVMDTVWKSEPCYLLKTFILERFDLTTEDILRIENMGYRISDEDIATWVGSTINNSKTYIISKKDYALLHYTEHRRQTLPDGTFYDDYTTSNFVKKGKNYVLDNVYRIADRYHPKMGVFARNGLKTLIYIYRPNVQKTMDNATIRYYPHGLINYDRFCTPMKKPTPLMNQTFYEKLQLFHEL